MLKKRFYSNIFTGILCQTKSQLNYFDNTLMRRSNLLILLMIWIGLLLTSASCATQAVKKQKAVEKKLAKEEKERKKAYEKLRKQHFQMQSPETQKRMKESEKRYKAHQKKQRK